MNFATTLKRLRIAAGLTQEQLAHACGYSGQSRIGNYESSRPKARQPKPDELPIIAKALGVSVAQLFGEVAQESGTPYIDHEIVAKVARALLKVANDPNNEEPFTFNFMTEYGLFIQLYEEAIQGRLTPTSGAVKIGRWQERRHQGADADGRRDGLPATGTHKGTKKA